MFIYREIIVCTNIMCTKCVFRAKEGDIYFLTYVCNASEEPIAQLDICFLQFLDKVVHTVHESVHGFKINKLIRQNKKHHIMVLKLEKLFSVSNEALIIVIGH